MFGEAIYFVRLACVRHAASVRPEPGSNSRLIFSLAQAFAQLYLSFFTFLFSFIQNSQRFLMLFYCLSSVPLPEELLQSNTTIYMLSRHFFTYFFCCFANNLYSLTLIQIVVNYFFIFLFASYFHIFSSYILPLLLLSNLISVSNIKLFNSILIKNALLNPHPYFQALV